MYPMIFLFFFFFNDTATTEIYTLSLHDALPISYAGEDDGPRRVRALGQRQLALEDREGVRGRRPRRAPEDRRHRLAPGRPDPRSEEHTSELQSRQYLVCRLLLEKKKERAYARRQ